MVDSPLSILQINSTDIEGGAASVAWNLFQVYRQRGCRSWLAVGQKRSSDPDVLSISHRHSHEAWFRFWETASLKLKQLETAVRLPTLLARTARAVAEPARSIDLYRGLEDFHYPGSAHVLDLPRSRASIVHGHNLHGSYFDLRLLPWISQNVPVVLTLHDAWLLSGHCAHSLGCERWKTGCGRCPDLTLYPAIRRDATALNWRRKREIFEKCRLNIATPSRWLMDKVEQSMLAPAMNDARVIPNGVDLSIFRPGNRQAVRAELGIPEDAVVLLFTAHRAKRNIWKDFSTMRAAITIAAEQLPDRQILLLALGDDGDPGHFGRAAVRYVPYQADPRVVATYCQAADLYVHSSRADTFPTVVLEALACGTPVVATAVGGIPEQIEVGRTGFLAEPADVQSFATCLVRLISDDGVRHQFGLQASRSAATRFDLQKQVDTYLEWYQELVAFDGGDTASQVGA